MCVIKTDRKALEDKIWAELKRRSENLRQFVEGMDDQEWADYHESIEQATSISEIDELIGMQSAQDTESCEDSLNEILNEYQNDINSQYENQDHDRGKDADVGGNPDQKADRPDVKKPTEKESAPDSKSPEIKTPGDILQPENSRLIDYPSQRAALAQYGWDEIPDGNGHIALLDSKGKQVAIVKGIAKSYTIEDTAGWMYWK